MSTSPNLNTYRIKGYELGETIGQGGFSTVYRAYDYKVQMVVACKVVPITKDTTDTQRKELHKEITIHSQLNHTNILQFYDSLVVENDGKNQIPPGVYILLELASAGDLFDKIAPDYGVEDELAHNYFRELISALIFIHDIGVCHRDLKPENILLDSLGRLKLSDFGLSSVYKHKGQERRLSERCGSLPYVAPEVNNTRDKYRGEPIDVWGAGVILFTLLVGNTPWDEPSTNSPEYMAFLSGNILHVAPWDRIRGHALELLLDCLTVDPAQRITLAEITQHPWFQRPSQLAQRPGEVAERLTQALARNGDMAISEPNFVETTTADNDDQVMMTATNGTQFTRTLMLFSQTQHGTRYQPHLTRFYAGCSPPELLEYLTATIIRLELHYKVKPEKSLIRVGGYDRRKEKFMGAINVEPFEWEGGKGSRCVMQRQSGNPMEWRRLWKIIATSDEVGPYVLRRTAEDQSMMS
ncbi:CAMK/CAMKL/CHK1 protein kinase [Clavulina sp. PMI_390]|nr:CAMK/CAMKL/CHK1 protein kinase [Clavulina sp. PMI_390]